MKVKAHPLGLLAVLVSGILLFGGCAGPATDAPPSATETTAGTDQAGYDTDSKDEEAPETGQAGPSADSDRSSGTDGDDDSGDQEKPDKAAVKSGLKTLAGSESASDLTKGKSDAALTKLIDCWGEQAYARLSDESLSKIAAGQMPDDAGDLQKFSSIVQGSQCQE